MPRSLTVELRKVISQNATLVRVAQVKEREVGRRRIVPSRVKSTFQAPIPTRAAQRIPTPATISIALIFSLVEYFQPDAPDYDAVGLC